MSGTLAFLHVSAWVSRLCCWGACEEARRSSWGWRAPAGPLWGLRGGLRPPLGTVRGTLTAAQRTLEDTELRRGRAWQLLRTSPSPRCSPAGSQVLGPWVTLGHMPSCPCVAGGVQSQAGPGPRPLGQGSSPRPSEGSGPSSRTGQCLGRLGQRLPDFPVLRLLKPTELLLRVYKRRPVRN